jgi:hypothetical protein
MRSDKGSIRIHIPEYREQTYNKGWRKVGSCGGAEGGELKQQTDQLNDHLRRVRARQLPDQT